MSIFRRLSNGLSCGDSIPFYHDGMYHLFSYLYQKTLYDILRELEIHGNML